jgi:hypothetical protein
MARRNCSVEEFHQRRANGEAWCYWHQAWEPITDQVWKNGYTASLCQQGQRERGEYYRLRRRESDRTR